MSEQRPDPGYRWATHDDPDFLVVQLAPAPVVTDSGPVDVMRALLARRGFRPVSAGAELDLGASNGCLLTVGDDGHATLVVTVGERVGATRLPLTDLDPEWWARATALGHAAVMVADTAVEPDGTTTREALLRDVEAGGVLAALVPAEAG